MWLVLSSVALATVPPPYQRGLLNRPVLSGPVERIDVDEFRVHYTLEGVDATSSRDSDGNGRPDFVDVVIEGLRQGRDLYAAEGWRPTVEDDGAGGSVALDVYLLDLPVNGYAFPLPGDDGAACFIEIDPGLGTTGDIATSVAMHELHHCIQFRYNATLPGWIYESASTYEQYSHVANPALDLAVRLLYLDELTAMDTRLASEDGENDPYTSFLWMKFWTEFDADEPALERLPAMWEALAQADRWRPALEVAADAEFGLPLEVMFLQYATWNSFACGGEIGQHYNRSVLDCGGPFTVSIEEVVPGQDIRIRHDQGPFTAHYVETAVDQAQTLDLSCEGNDVYTAWMALDEQGQLLHTLDSLIPEQTLRIGVPAGGRGRAVIVGTRGALTADCQISRVLPTATESSGCRHGPTPALWAWLGVLLLPRRRC